MTALKDPSPAELAKDGSFLEDMARFGEGSMSEKRIKKKWGWDDAVWDKLGEDEELVEAIELEKEHRLRSGLAARELAAKEFIAAPGVLGGILKDRDANPRHRIESAKELRQIATPPQEAAATAAARFIINIDMGGDVKLKFDKPIAIGADDPDRVDVTALAVIAVNKPTDGGSGQPV
jgi:hypothetical protein